MKRATLILLAAIGMLLGTSKYASASDFSGNCSDFVTWSNTDGNGNATVSDSSCSISSDASATGFITITADSVDAQDLSAGGTLTITSSSGSISAGALTTSGGYVWLTANSGTITLSDDIQTNGGTVVLWASQDISAFDIDAGGFGDHSDVRIFANQDNSGSDTFNIGSGGDANGVGSIFDSNDVGGNIIYIANAGSGGITYSSAELTVDASAAKSGQIIFDASHGTGSVVLNGGTISIDNDDGFLGGNVSIMTSTGTGAQVVVADDMTISTNSSSSSSTLSGAGVGIATDQLIMNANLTISVNGNGPIGGGIGGVNQVGWLNITVPTDPTMPIPGFSYSVTDNPLSITGTGTLEFDAAGNNNYIVVGGNSMVLTAPTVINNTGSNTHTFLWSHDSSTNQAMTIGNVQAYAETESSSDTPGNVTLAADEITSVTGLVWLEASSNGGANGGTVEVDLNEGTLPLNYYGNALALWSLANDSGNGGTVNVNAGTADVIVQDPFGAPNVSVTGTGNGGTINVTGNSLTTSGDFAAIFFAQGNGSGGNGGIINIQVAGDLAADASNGGIFAIANAQVAGDGGNVTLNAGGTLDIDGGIAIQVAGVTDGTTSGNGGTLTATAGDTLNTGGDQIDASGALNGNGGTISLTADAIESFGSQLITANAMGSGNGGSITLNSSDDLNLDADDFQVNANAADTGNGGTITITGQDVSISNEDDAITVTAGTSGNGGTISISSTGGDIDLDSNLDASAGSTQGLGGNITLNASGSLTSDSNSVLSANGNGTGNGGSIVLSAESDLAIGDGSDNAFQLNSSAIGTGNGGSVSVSSDGDITADGGSINVAAGSNGTGGNISITALSNLTVSGNLDADGTGSQNGGYVVLAGNSSSALTITDTTLITANSGASGGNGGVVSISNTGGSILMSGNAKVRATAFGDSGNGGSVSFVAGQGSADGSLTFNGEFVEVEADSGDTSGTGGTILLKYTDNGGTGQLSITDASVSADGTTSGGTITSTNSANAALNVVISTGTLSAQLGQLVFNQSNKPVSVSATAKDAMSPPLEGVVTAGLDADVSTFALTVDNVSTSSSNDTILGTIKASTSASISAPNGGDIDGDGSDSDLITTPTLTFNGTFRTIGAINPLQTSISELDATSGTTAATVNIQNPGTDEVTIGDGWSVQFSFNFASAGNVSIGNITQTGPYDSDSFNGISIGVFSGTLTVREDTAVLAKQGSIDFQVAVGDVQVMEGAVISADSNESTDLTLGNVDIEVSPGTYELENYTNGDIENVEVFPETAVFTGGPNGLTADVADDDGNTLLILNRFLTLAGPVSSSIHLYGNIAISATGAAE